MRRVLSGNEPATPPLPTSQMWIISRREDLTWFIGSSLAGYAAILLMWRGVALLPLQLIWLFGVDGPHVTSTVTRTYFDRAARQKLGWFLWIVFPLLLVGPVMALAGQAALFFLIAFCWQQVHVVKQHVGFVMIYKAKNHERDQFDRTIDRWFLLTSLFTPLGLFVLNTEQPLPPGASRIVSAIVLALYGALTVAWLLRQSQKLRSGAEMNWPKLALFAVTVPLQWLALQFAERFGAAGSLQAAIPLGLFHGLQYHRLMWFHNRNRYADPQAIARNGLAARAASNVMTYLAVAVGLNFALGFIIPSLAAPYATGQGAVVLQASLWGISFTHYCLDARIWHVRDDKELAVALRLAQPVAITT